ncbi:MAG: TonB-dependent receptor [Gemmatimonadota bacterium]|nr:TonB-dependent receptor [Gemmatimonadota bacterium]
MNQPRPRPPRLCAALVATVALSWSGALQAQSTGTITGVVRDAQSRQPLAAVQISIPTTNTGTLSQASGRYLLINVPAGTHEIRLERLGYQPVTQNVTVRAGEATQVDFEISEQAIQLDAVVVTGTPGGTQRRAIGNVVAQVDAAELTEIAPITTMQDLLGGREAGVDFSRGSGNVGTGSSIRIRGFSSLNVGNQPLIYVDGVRVDNNASAGPALRDGAQASKLDDINPDDIESIEIIKGPAAATLYGTEASNGVIQIITKRGQQGAPQFSMTVRQGGNFLMDPQDKVPVAYGIGDNGEIISFNVWDQEKAAGRAFFGTGHTQAYNLSMNGGTETVRYYLSGDWDDQTGIVDYNWNRALSLRANVSVVAHEKLSLDASTGYVDGETSFMQQRTSYGLWEQAQWSSPEGIDTKLRGFLRARPEKIETVDAIRENSRFIGSLTTNYRPTDWLTQRLVVGLDVANEENRVFFPKDTDGDFGGLSQGFIQVDRPRTRYTTFDFATSARWGLSENLRFTSSVGVQYYAKRLETVFTEGRNFPAPSISSLSGAAVATSNEAIVENKTLGGYLQHELSWRDRVFLTAAVRGDDNSAFGSNYDAAVYPKFSATWVVSDEDFWGLSAVNSLRLRTAWGKAGQQPDVFAAVRLYQPAVGPGSAPVVTPAEVGNSDLGPEVATELEVGFDAALFEDRLSTEVTYYRQRVEDALVSLPVAPSRGFPGTQFVNLGEVFNHGVEVQLNSRMLQRRNLAWDLGVGLSWNRNEVVDAGGLPPTTTVREGFPFPAYFAEVVTSAELNPNTRRAENILCDGGTGKNGWEAGGTPVPCSSASDAPEVFLGPGYFPWNWKFNTTFTLFDDIRVFGLVEMQRGGNYQYIEDVGCRHTCFRTSLAANERTDPIFLAYADTPISSAMLGTYRADFAKLREIAVAYELPASLVGRTGAERASFSVAARNLWTLWTAQDEIFGSPIPDPEARRAADVGTYSNSNMPPTSSIIATLRVTF